MGHTNNRTRPTFGAATFWPIKAFTYTIPSFCFRVKSTYDLYSKFISFSSIVINNIITMEYWNELYRTSSISSDCAHTINDPLLLWFISLHASAIIIIMLRIQGITIKLHLYLRVRFKLRAQHVIVNLELSWNTWLINRTPRIVRIPYKGSLLVFAEVVLPCLYYSEMQLTWELSFQN